MELKYLFPIAILTKYLQLIQSIFWVKPLEFISEIYRVLKINGILILTFAQKDFMKNLPFVKSKFSLYDNGDLSLLIKKTEFKIIEIEIENMTEKIKSKSGELVERIYSVVNIKKTVANTVYSK